jgi:hypothetical protein
MKNAGFLSWILVIAIGVCLGNLASNFITAAYVAIQAQVAMQEASKRMAAEQQRLEQRSMDLQQKQAEKRAEQGAAIRRQREGDVTGKELGRLCREWEAQYERTPTPFVDGEKRKVCRRFSDYVNTGTYRTAEN